MKFGEALEHCRNGLAIQREGWNGKGMYVVYQPAYPDGIPINPNTAKAINEEVGTIKKFLPYLMMRTVSGAFVPWTISQTDALADDWLAFNLADRPA